MNTKFKPLGLVAAVAAVTAGYAGITNAATLSATGLGDLAIIPYYTTRGDFVTGVHITNTSDLTQVVKMRMRRGTDSMDALDFNLVLSPEDVWTGFISATPSGNITFTTTDNSCTVPATTNGVFTMPGIFRPGADEGYIEVIGMGSADEDQPIYDAALHGSDGMPADCAAVRSNFFANNSLTPTFTPDLTKRGVISSDTTHQTTPTGVAPNEYGDTGNVLQVSYFVRDSGAGLEAGGKAVHLENFLPVAAMSNQEFGLLSGDLQGFDYPDLNGGSPLDAPRGRYEAIRTQLGFDSVINDWSANDDLNVGTDWVITVPGQYAMLNLPQYLLSLFDVEEDCDGDPAVIACDNRDLPLEADFEVYDREEQTLVGPEGELVVSPALPGTRTVVELPREVNVVQWGSSPVLDGDAPISVTAPEGAVFGWARLAVTPTDDKTQAICDFDPTAADYLCTSVVETSVPMVGFVAWERSFPSNPSANYGRIVDHSYSSND